MSYFCPLCHLPYQGRGVCSRCERRGYQECTRIEWDFRPCAEEDCLFYAVEGSPYCQSCQERAEREWAAVSMRPRSYTVPADSLRPERIISQWEPFFKAVAEARFTKQKEPMDG